MLCPAQDSCSLSSSRFDSPAPSASKTSALFNKALYIYKLVTVLVIIKVYYKILFLIFLVTGSTPTHTPCTQSTDSQRDRSSAGRKHRSPAKFKPPDQPPARKDWVPDTQHHVCMVCRRERFTMVSGHNGVTLTMLSFMKMKQMVANKMPCILEELNWEKRKLR